MTFLDFKNNKNSKLGEKIFEKHHLHFIGYFSAIFLSTIVLLAVFGLLPSELQENSDGNTFVESVEHSALEILEGQSTNQAGVQNGAEVNGQTSGQTGAQNGTQVGAQNSNKNILAFTAVQLMIPTIGVDTVIRNPVSTDAKSLDYELTQGAVHYPGSGTVGAGNMFLFGHSTSFSIVQNKAYKVFNEIKTLNAGDLIYVDAVAKTSTNSALAGSTVTKTFVYKVRDVTKVNKDDTLIKFDTTKNMLTLSTCNSFGAKTDRYVVQADFVGVR